MVVPALRAEWRRVVSTRLWWALLIPVAVLAVLVNLFGGLLGDGLGDVGGDLPVLPASVAFTLTLTAVFAAIAVLIAGLVEDRLKGLAAALAVWLVLGVAWDGLVLWAAIAFRDHAIERLMLALTFANPVDLARVLLVAHMDVATLMGYTGAVFQKVLGGVGGTALALGGLTAWALVPGLLALRAFHRRDF